MEGVGSGTRYCPTPCKKMPRCSPLGGVLGGDSGLSGGAIPLLCVLNARSGEADHSGHDTANSKEERGSRSNVHRDRVGEEEHVHEDQHGLGGLESEQCSLLEEWAGIRPVAVRGSLDLVIIMPCSPYCVKSARERVPVQGDVTLFLHKCLNALALLFDQAAGCDLRFCVPRCEQMVTPVFMERRQG